MREFDFLLIGQGIAGSTLAWHLRWLNQSVAVVDREEELTASKVASGLISPLAGKRNAVSWRFDSLWRTACAFYERVERETDSEFLHRKAMWRVMKEGATLDHPSAQRYVVDTRKLPSPLNAELQAAELAPAARLDVCAFLNASRQVLQREEAYFAAELNPNCDLALDGELVRLPKLNLAARRVIFCQGIDGRGNAFFPNLHFEPAKGQILTLEIPELRDSCTADAKRVVNGDVWLVPQSDGRFFAGATFESEFADRLPTEAGRLEILKKLSTFVSTPCNVVHHRAAVRPIVQGRLPALGLAAADERLGFFNGLGSKGALRAPWVAEQFAHFLVNATDVLDEIWLNANVGGNSNDAEIRHANPARRLTELAKQQVAQVLQQGDMAIDATAGNGFDTLFLANQVGDTGRVFALDVQQAALDRTCARLEAAGIQNTTCILGSHSQFEMLLPTEYRDSIAAVMFNLGYLPRGDKRLVTEAMSTQHAIQCSLRLLRPGGVVTVVAYTGHPGGFEEATAIETCLRALPECEFETQMPTSPVCTKLPRLYVIRKLSHGPLSSSRID